MNYSDKINPVVREMKPSGIRKFFDVAAKMPDVISLGVGEPDFVTPWGIRDAAIKSLQRGYTQYTGNRGLGELTQEIALYLASRFGATYDPASELLVTVGASEALDVAMRTLTRPGDEVLIPDPSFVSYAPCVALCGATPVPVVCSADNGFKLTVEALEAAVTPETRVVILPFPNNPTGAVMHRADLEPICSWIVEHDLTVISDEIYAELTYGGKHVSAATLPGMRERTVLVSGFSKAFAMTGWRLGYAAAPKPFTDAMLKIHQYTIMCAPSASQYAGLAALRIGREDGYAAVADMREKYDLRRRFLVAEFNDMGLDCFEPEGAFYVFPCVKRCGMDGETFANELLAAKHVAVVPGEAFGASGRDYVRCSYATGMRDLETAVGRIREFVAAVRNH